METKNSFSSSSFGKTVPLSLIQSPQPNRILSLVIGNLNVLRDSSPESERDELMAFRRARATEHPKKKGGSPIPFDALIDPKLGYSASLRRATLKI